MTAEEEPATNQSCSKISEHLNLEDSDTTDLESKSKANRMAQSLEQVFISGRTMAGGTISTAHLRNHCKNWSQVFVNIN